MGADALHYIRHLWISCWQLYTDCTGDTGYAHVSNPGGVREEDCQRVTQPALLPQFIDFLYN